MSGRVTPRKPGPAMPGPFHPGRAMRWAWAQQNRLLIELQVAEQMADHRRRKKEGES